MSTTNDISHVYHGWLDAVSTRDWDSASKLFASEILHNEETITSQTFLGRVRDEVAAMPDSRIETSIFVLDDPAEKIAAQLVHRGTLVKPHRGVADTGKQIQWSEYVFCGFRNGKLSAWMSLWDLDASKSQSTSNSTGRFTKRDSDVDLKNLYRQYIHSINTLTMAEHFPDYCQPRITHNGINLSIDEYRSFIESSFEEIKGLKFTIAELVADKESQRLAARLEFSGCPVAEFRGIQPTGNEVTFSEHVLYELDEGKIARVWSVLDLEAYRMSIQK
ncbi:hypothetical protein AK830_g7320 [Neonectria ditissima]|uniref:SnoaL-like domain-containing protein n=1 Tax=Neonectria ditissima TaxID=78410 RepID=A0A0P7AN95_9HYPO|nr:hypothetical protein AK830_g7320 [Neonectria ditissima]